VYLVEFVREKANATIQFYTNVVKYIWCNWIESIIKWSGVEQTAQEIVDYLNQMAQQQQNKQVQEQQNCGEIVKVDNQSDVVQSLPTINLLQLAESGIKCGIKGWLENIPPSAAYENVCNMYNLGLQTVYEFIRLLGDIEIEHHSSTIVKYRHYQPNTMINNHRTDQSSVMHSTILPRDNVEHQLAYESRNCYRTTFSTRNLLSYTSTSTDFEYYKLGVRSTREIPTLRNHNERILSAYSRTTTGSRFSIESTVNNNNNGYYYK